MKEKWAATVNIKDGGKMSRKERRIIAAWLAGVGRTLVELGHAMAPGFRARYQFPTKTKGKR